MNAKKASVKNVVETHLTPEKIAELNEAVEARRRSVTTLIQAVITGVKIAASFYGPGGHGKTWAVMKELDALTGKTWVHHTGSVTPRALFDTLRTHKDSLHVFEDMEELLKSPPYGKLLRPALDDGRDERWISWETADDVAKFVFNGGIIIVGNEDLSKSRSEIGEAVKSRMKPVRWELTVNEMMAVMKRMADAGYAKRGHSLTPKQCHEVADYLIGKLSRGEAMIGIDLRFFASHALPARVHAIITNSGDDWKNVIDAMLSGQISEVESQQSRAERMEKIALQVSLLKLTKAEKAAKWEEMTAMKVANFYIHLKNAKNRNR